MITATQSPPDTVAPGMPARLLRGTVTAAALAWAGWLMYQADLPRAWAQVCETTTPGQRLLLAGLFMLPSLGNGWVETRSWLLTFGGRRPRVGFARLFWIRMAGEAVNQATPLASVGGEPVKALLLAREGERVARSAASVLSARLIITLAQVLYILAGAGLALGAPGTRAEQVALLAAFPACLGALLVALFVLRSLAPAAWRRRMLGHRLVARYADDLRQVAGAFLLWRTHPFRFAAALLLALAGWVVVAAEFWLVARVLGIPLTWLEAFWLEALTNAVAMSTFFVPGNLGAQEAGLLYLAQTYRLGDPLGPVMLVLRRARELLWIALGLGFLALCSVRPAAAAGVPAAAEGSPVQ